MLKRAFGNTVFFASDFVPEKRKVVVYSRWHVVFLFYFVQFFPDGHRRFIVPFFLFIGGVENSNGFKLAYFGFGF